MRLIAMVLIATSALIGPVMVQGADTGADAYRFPIHPGMPEWATLQTHEDMLAACQIPEDLLARMSTPALARTCLTYPLAFEFLAFNTADEGVAKAASHFNGLQELMAREDGAAALLAEYTGLDPLDSRVCPEGNETPCLFELMYVETLFSQPAIFEKLTRRQQTELLGTCRRNAIARMNDPRYGMMQLRAAGRLMSKTLIAQGDPGFTSIYESDAGMQSFLQGAPQPDSRCIDQIIRSADAFLRRAQSGEESR